MYTTEEIFEFAVHIEENGERFYRDAQLKVSDPGLRSLFEWLRQEEVKHRDWFLQCRDNLPPEKGDPILIEASRSILKDIIGDQTFSLEEVDLSKIHTPEDLLAIAEEFEKDTVLFFELIKNLVHEPGTLKHLEEIIEEERGHIQMIKERRADAYQPTT